MIALLLPIALAAADPAAVAVLVDSKRPGGAQEADELASLVYLALIDAGAPRDDVLVEEQAERRTLTGAFTRTRQCEGRAQCLRQLASLLGPGAVIIGIDVGRVAGELAVHVLAVRSVADPLAELDVSVDSATWRTALAPAVAVFAQKVVGQLSGAAPPAPVAAAAPTVIEVVETDHALPSPLRWSVAGGALVSFVAGAVLLGTGLSAKSTYDRSLVVVDGVPGTMLTAAEASRLGTQANVQLSLALGAALLGAVLSGIAAWLFMKG